MTSSLTSQGGLKIGPLYFFINEITTFFLITKKRAKISSLNFLCIGVVRLWVYLYQYIFMTSPMTSPGHKVGQILKLIYLRQYFSQSVDQSVFTLCVCVCLSVCLCLSWCLSGQFNYEGLVPHKRYFAGTLLGMSSCASYVSRTNDVIDDVTRSQSRSNFEIDIFPSIFELERQSKAPNIGNAKGYLSRTLNSRYNFR